MIKTIYFIVLVFVFATGCSEKKDAGKNDDTITDKKQGGSIKDSYTADTLYQALPYLLEDLAANKNMQELLAQNWIMEDDKDALELASDDGKIELPVRSLAMAKDFTIVKNCRNAIDEGIWEFNTDKKTLKFKYNNGSGDLYKLRALAIDEMQLTNIGIGSETVLKFVSDAKCYKNKNEDPFYFRNNKWRIKPTRPENDDAIKQRLKENIYFFILYYRDAIARRASLVSFYGFPSCLKWYAGGIHLQAKEELSEKWEDCFYSKAQAAKAYEIMDKVLGKKYNWPKGDANWIKKNLFVLEQMYQQLNSF